MDYLDKIHATSKLWIDAMLTPAGAIQLVIIVLAVMSAWYLNNAWQRYAAERLGPEQRAGLARFALRSAARALFPLMLSMLLFAGAGIMVQFGVKPALLSIMAPLLLSLAVIRIVVYALRRVYSPSPALRALEGLIATLVWLGVALYLLGWLADVQRALDSIAVTVGTTRVSVFSVMKLVTAIAFFVVAAGWIARMVEQRVRRAGIFSASMQVGLSKSIKVVLYTFAVLIALNSVGIDLTTLTVFGGALGVGLGFGLQRIASNFISGFILLFDRSIKPGDVISIGQRFGWVVALHARYIVVRDRDGVETLIPNENLITSEVTNWSYTDRHVRIKLPVTISYKDDPVQAMAILEKAAEASPRVLADPAPQARMLEFGDNGIRLELRVWLMDPESGIGSVRTEINLAIWEGFKAVGITIPYPQHEVRLIGQAHSDKG